MRFIRSAFFLIFSIVCVFIAQADTWQYGSLGGANQTMIVYHNEIYAFFGSIAPYAVRRSTDGATWTDLALPETIAGKAVSFRIHKDALFIFVDPTLWVVPVDAAIYRTTDGQTFTKMRQDPSSSLSLTYKAAASFGEYLYVVLRDGRVVRTSGTGPAPNWESVASIPGWQGDSYASLAAFNGALYVAVNIETSVGGTLHYDKSIFRLSATTAWESVGNFSSAEDASADEYIRLITKADKLLFVGQYVWETTGVDIPHIWIKKQLPYPSLFRPVVHVIGEDLYIWSASTSTVKHRVLKYDRMGQWSFGSIDTVDHLGQPALQIYVEEPLIWKGQAYVPAARLWSLRLGLESLSAQPIQTTKLFSGQKQAVVHALKATINHSDRLKMTVLNFGTAVSGRDIEKLYLAGGERVIGSFVVDSIDPKLWRLDSFSSELFAEDEDLYILADVASTAQNSTIILSVENGSIQCATNTSYTLPVRLTAASIQIEHVATASDIHSLDEVQIYPQPAQGHVRFRYNINSVSDVTIKIFDRAGVTVSEINEPARPVGINQTTWDSSSMATGVYYAVIKVNGADGSTRTLRRKISIKK